MRAFDLEKHGADLGPLEASEETLTQQGSSECRGRVGNSWLPFETPANKVLLEIPDRQEGQRRLFQLQTQIK